MSSSIKSVVLASLIVATLLPHPALGGDPGPSPDNRERTGSIFRQNPPVALGYGTLGMPAFADPAAPIHQHVAPYYLQETTREIGLQNVVTAVLASYRGYDTLGELTVILTAGISVMLLLGIHIRGTEQSRNDP